MASYVLLFSGGRMPETPEEQKAVREDNLLLLVCSEIIPLQEL